MDNNVNLNGVIIDLGLDSVPRTQALNKILHYSIYKGLNIYFDNTIQGVRANCDTDEIHDERGELCRVMMLEKDIYCEGQKLLIASKGFDSCNEDSILVSGFEYNNKSYYPVEESGTFIRNQWLSIFSFYCLKNELKIFIRNNNSNSPSPKKKNAPVLEQREAAFKEWLIASRKSPGENLSEIYIDLGEPTQDEIWAKLHKHNSKLFKAGKDDFFRDQRLILFKVGTSKGR
ncbi:MAG TPA: hypothetical protein EYQ86_02905 [Bacteroidetes bacterium]|nr:hypothetical protein [Bacteroidota bacterium]